MDSNAEITPYYAESDTAHVASMGGFDDNLERAGHAANTAFRHDVFSDYRATCRPNTLQRHDYDLRAFSTFLNSFGIRRSIQALRSNPAAWRGMTYGILVAFRRWLEEKGEAVGTIKAR
ncbi:MAG TPA: hypothetical protein VJO32_03030, partial [Ktedonobacteraceae bacterium]|nr:hypothetical protein [Ktedonobacteraceae bacterium]